MASTFSVRDWWMKHYSLHLLRQYRCRQVYYHEREQSRLTAEGCLVAQSSTATFILDAMDQAKFCVPRHMPCAKALADTIRPRLHVVGVICAGYFSAGWIVDPTIQKNADLWIEIFMRCIQLLQEECHRLVPTGTLTKYGWEFHKNWDKYETSALYGFKLGNLQIEYHNVKSASSTWVRYRCANCMRSTDNEYFVRSEKDAASFMENFRRITEPLMIEDRVDTEVFMRSRSNETVAIEDRVDTEKTVAGRPPPPPHIGRNLRPSTGRPPSPPPPPKKPDYECQFEYMRHVNDDFKAWLSGGKRLSSEATEDEKMDVNTKSSSAMKDFRLSRASSYLRSLAVGGTEFWADPPLQFSIGMEPAQQARIEDVASAGEVVLQPNIVEPLSKAKFIKAIPIKNKRKRKTQHGKGKMSARRVATE